MRLETLPLLLGIVLALIALALVIDALTPDELVVPRERRRGARAPRDRFGEALLGLGVGAMAAAFAGRDTWRYSVVSVIAGAILLLWGIVRNRSYLKGSFRRADVSAAVPGPAAPADPGPRRIR